MLVIVAKPFYRGWNVGDTVELFGEELKQRLEEGNVMPTQRDQFEDGIICQNCGRKCASEFGLKAHMRSHKKEAEKI